MSGLRTAALGAACSLLVAACSTKPAGDASAANTVDTGSVSAGASAASIDSARSSTPAVAAPATDTARAATTPAATAGSGAATTSAAPPAGTGSAGKTTAPAAPRPSGTPRKDAAPAAKTSPAASPAVAKSATAPTTSASASASSAASSATPAAATAGAQSGSVKVNKFMSYDAAAKTVTLDIIAAYNSVQGGFNFNGGSNGNHTITVPAGWQVTMHVKNVDAIPHSAIVIADQRPLPNAPDAPAIPRAYTAHVNDGLQPQTGADDLSFRASKPGKYLIYCGVPGHGPSGMFIGFVVSESATVPSYQM